MFPRKAGLSHLTSVTPCFFHSIARIGSPERRRGSRLKSNLKSSGHGGDLMYNWALHAVDYAATSRRHQLKYTASQCHKLGLCVPFVGALDCRSLILTPFTTFKAISALSPFLRV